MLDVAHELFAKGGGRVPSMDAVAAAAGVTRTAIYHYFPTKQDLVRAVLMRGMAWNWWISAIDAAQELNTFSARLHRLLAECIDRSKALEQGDFYFALLAAATEDQEIRSAVRSYGEDMRTGIRTLVSRSVADGLLPETTDAELLSRAVLGLVWAVAAGMHYSPSERVHEEIELAARLVAADFQAFQNPRSA